MAYQALYRKYRPRTFDDVVGQEHITTILKNQIKTGKTSHAYLFTGTRGTGKTTCAKILARALNCEHPKDGNPCCECFACKGIESGSILDVVELDAASNNGVDSVRALRDEAVYSPAAVRRRVYIIDEVHMLSTAAFNALLKIMEEPPEHLVFILATTELYKVPATILSRCQRYAFKRISAADIEKRLGYVAGLEGIDLTAGACELIARLSDGALRDALSLLDQCATGGQITEERVRSALGLAGSLLTEKLLDAIIDGDSGTALELLDSYLRDGGGETVLLGELSVLIRDALITLVAPKKGDSLISGSHMRETLTRFASIAGGRRLMELLDRASDALEAMGKTSGRRTIAELCLMEMCGTAEAFPAASPVKKAQTAHPEQPETKPEQPETKPAAPPAEVPETKDKAPWEEAPEETKAAESEKKTAPQTQREEEPKAAPAPERVKAAAHSADAAQSKEIPAADSADAWKRILKEFERIADPPLYFALSNPMKVSGELTESSLTVYTKDLFYLNMFSIADNVALLRRAAQQSLGRAVTVRVVKDERKPVPNEEKLARLALFDNVEFEN